MSSTSPKRGRPATQKSRTTSQTARGPAGAPPAGAARRRSLVGIAAIAVSVLVIAFARVGGRYLKLPAAPPPTAQGQSAVIVDQLSLTFPNPDFRQSATDTLAKGGYRVDYVPGDQVSVGYFMGLPARDYDLIVLRSHSARLETKEGEKTDNVALFTGELIDLEKYNVKSVPPQAATAVARVKATQAAGGAGAGVHGDTGLTLGPAELKHVIPVFYDPHSGELPFFGLQPSFIAQNLQGSFKPSTVVVLMGCDGLRANEMASAFIQKGAGNFISWDHPVTAAHTDQATLRLLDYLFVQKLPVAQAVQKTMDEVGPDPVQHSRLSYFPAQANPAP